MRKQELQVFFDWYVPYTGNKWTCEQIAELDYLWSEALNQHIIMPFTLILRDFHLENMMYLGTGLQIGLLDFQDALYGCPIYDLVSVLEDARFDVPRDFALGLIDNFTRYKNWDKDVVLLNYHLLGAQRNCRILGVFARKFLKENNSNYLQYLPRVKKYLQYDFTHPILHKIKRFCQNYLEL
jgi:hypothetical protein